ncbi:hypothetical protein [Microbacterium sp. 77mftsu3.1]|uniref:phage tail tube protein n=1 Tax=Microbacterium sp. 77mftsu3.1 TaxID=1761802 RepID=UPI00088F3DEA|nr:hypothetical protein [Microbacterium sp. 77mftsu3.1]SDG21533.1 hypothetical protein SAMN04488590_0208 [Microbacterium sp. 77mftsu3.1]
MQEAVQRGQAADGRGIVLWAPTIADPTKPTVAELNAASVKRLTYGLAPDGFNHSMTIATITAGRYTLDQALELDGTVTDTVEVRWVYNRTTPTQVETVLGTPGVDGNIVHILGYPNDHEIDEDTKINAIIPVTTSIPRDVPPTANSELMKIQKLNVRDKVRREHEITVQAA